MIQAPIFHVNGDDPEACVRVAALAYEYRQTFHKDVVIDMVCYRRHGHNEGDDPSYTQPLMYQAIDARRSVRKLFTEALVRRGDITLDEAEAALADFQQRLQVALDETRAAEAVAGQGGPAARRPSACCPTSRPASTAATLDAIFDHLTDLPRGLHAPPQAGPPVRHPRQAVPRGRRGRVGHGRGAGLRLAAARGHRRAPGRRGHPPGHVQPAPHGPGRLRARASRGCRCSRCPNRQAPPLGVRLAAVGVRRRRLRVRLLGGQQGRARAVGGAVRRLRQRRPGRHRPVPGGGRGQVGPDVGPRAAAAPRLRGPGARALVGAHRALPHAVGRGQHPDRERHDGGAVLPPAAAPGAARRAQAARSSSRRRSRCA